LKESLVEINAFSDNNEKISRECAERFFETIYDALIDSYYEDPGSGAREFYDFSELSSIVYGYPEYYTPNASIAYQEFFEEILRNVFTGEMDLTGSWQKRSMKIYSFHAVLQKGLQGMISSFRLILLSDRASRF
jgi:hypothetical protein